MDKVLFTEAKDLLFGISKRLVAITGGSWRPGCPLLF